ncbi:MAG: SIS domain-containing protein [Myxococcota bacterium]|nr:SIS domain-containing protein [Myxococcota bacterium]
MLTEIQTLPTQLELGWRAAKTDIGSFERAIGRVVICGMGGSSFPGDIACAVLRDYGVEVSVVRDYALPAFLNDERALVIVSSFSGRTEESLSAYAQVKAQGLSPVMVTGNEALGRKIRAEGLGAVCLPTLLEGFQPRSAYGLFVGAFLALVDTAGLVPHSVLHTCVLESSRWVASLDGLYEECGTLVDALSDRIPLFCAPSPYGRALARVAKIKVNENAKTAAFWSELPEFNHNEMVGMTRGGDRFCAIIFDDPALPERLRARVVATAAVLEALNCRVVRQTLTGPNRLARIMGSLYRMDYVTLRLANLSGVNPRAVALIEQFKKDLGPWTP